MKPDCINQIPLYKHHVGNGCDRRLSEYHRLEDAANEQRH